MIAGEVAATAGAGAATTVAAVGVACRMLAKMATAATRRHRAVADADAVADEDADADGDADVDKAVVAAMAVVAATTTVADAANTRSRRPSYQRVSQ